MQILDPRSLVVGTALARSAWYVGTLTGRARRTRARRQIGILIGHQYDFEDGLHWPLVHWEGEPRPRLTHPRGVRPLRRTRAARYVSVAAGSLWVPRSTIQVLAVTRAVRGAVGHASGRATRRATSQPGDRP